MPRTAVDYSHLVGKYVRMERPADEVELRERQAVLSDTPDDFTVGAEGTVAAVWDSNKRVGGPAVEVMMDYGMGYPIFASAQDEWTFIIVDSPETLKGIWL